MTGAIFSPCSDCTCIGTMTCIRSPNAKRMYMKEREHARSRYKYMSWHLRAHHLHAYIGQRTFTHSTCHIHIPHVDECTVPGSVWTYTHAHTHTVYHTRQTRVWTSKFRYAHCMRIVYMRTTGHSHARHGIPMRRKPVRVTHNTRTPDRTIPSTHATCVIHTRAQESSTCKPHAHNYACCRYLC